MPIIDGQKWACESCIKGHRVSGCTHEDRPLKYIAPKGRPQKQCEHCRTARKSKSHHTKCDCGDKKDKTKGDLGFEVFGHDAPDMPEHECCCIHGGQCTCGAKKTTAGSKLESGSSRPAQHGAKSRPKVVTSPSENTLMVFANGHHKPSHRLNNAAHVSGAPYKIPRSHTLHGLPTAAQQTADMLQTNTNPVDKSQRSVDDSGLHMNSGKMLYDIAGPAQRSIDSLPLTFQPDRAAGVGHTDFTFDLPHTAPVTTSPGFAPFTNTQPTEIPATEPWSNFSGIMPRSLYGLDDYSTSPIAGFLASADNGWGVASAGAGPSWSAGDLPLNSDRASDSLFQPHSHSDGSNRHSAPDLTASSSGAQSEIGDSGLFGDLDLGLQQNTNNNALQVGLDQLNDQASYQLGASSVFDDLPQPTLSSSAPYDRRSLDNEGFGRVAHSMHENKAATGGTALSWQQVLSIQQTSTYLAQNLELPRQPSFDYNSLLAANPLSDINFSASDSVGYSVPEPQPRSMTMPADLGDFNGADWTSLLASAPSELAPLQPLDIGVDIPAYGSWAHHQ